MQSLRKPSIETQNFRCLQRFQKEERKPGRKKEEEEDQRQCRHTHKHGEPKTNTPTDKRRPITQRWVFRPPEFSRLPVAGSPYWMASTVHQTWGPERNFLSCRIGCPPACPLASALRRLGPLYRKLSSASDTFLLPSRASDLHWTFLPEHRCYYLSFPSVL